ncbi:MAG: vitamin K epoxide reductase family protein [Patescibacteria group bacterium]
MRKYIIIATLAAIGIFNAIYLSIPAYDYWNGANASALQMMPCDISDKLSCSGILQNPRAIIFSIGDFKVAFPMIAAVVYPILFIIALWGWFSKGTLPAKVLTAMSAGGILFNSYVIYQEFVVGVFCPLCAMCTVIIVAIFALSICIWKGKTTPHS